VGRGLGPWADPARPEIQTGRAGPKFKQYGPFRAWVGPGRAARMYTSILSAKHRARVSSFTTTKAVKRGAGASAGASSHPTLPRRPPRRVLRWSSSLFGHRLSPTPPRPRQFPHAPRHRRRPSRSSPGRRRRRVMLRRAQRCSRSPTSCTLSRYPRSHAELGGGGHRGGWSLGATQGAVRGDHHLASSLKG
jgi:hypothetical protein